MADLPDQMVPYGPVPLLYNVGRARMSDGQEMVVLIIDHQAGRDIHHLPPKHALNLGRLLEDQAEEAGAGDRSPARLVVPQGVLPFPLGRPAS